MGRQIKVKMEFCNSEKVGMLYGECHKNTIRAKAMYAERYPERNQPYLRECVNRFDEPEVLRLILSRRLRIMIDVVVLINTVT